MNPYAINNCFQYKINFKKMKRENRILFYSIFYWDKPMSIYIHLINEYLNVKYNEPFL